MKLTTVNRSAADENDTPLTIVQGRSKLPQYMGTLSDKENTLSTKFNTTHQTAQSPTTNILQTQVRLLQNEKNDLAARLQNCMNEKQELLGKCMKISSLEYENDELQHRLTLSQADCGQLSQLLNEKSAQINQLNKHIESLESSEFDMQILQQEYKQLQKAYDEMIKENENVLKLSRVQSIEQKSKLNQQKSNIQEQADQITILQEKIKKQDSKIKSLSEQNRKLEESTQSIIESQMEEKLQFESKINDLQTQNFKLQQEVERLNQHRLNLENETARLGQNESIIYERARHQIETTMAQTFIHEKTGYEKLLWEKDQQIQELQTQHNMLTKENSDVKLDRQQFLAELHQIRQSNLVMKQVEIQLRDVQEELEKYRVQMNHKNVEIQQLKQYQRSTEQVKGYVIELENRLNQQLQENQRLNGILMERCKNTW